MWFAVSDERTGLTFTIAAGPLQRSHFRVPVPWDSQPYFTVSDSSLPWDSQPYFTVSDSSLPFSSRPTTCRATVEVFDPIPPQFNSSLLLLPLLHVPNRKHRSNRSSLVAWVSDAAEICSPSRRLAMEVTLAPLLQPSGIIPQYVERSSSGA
jgi:hypothetical protein